MKQIIIHNPVNLSGHHTFTAGFRGTMEKVAEGEDVQLVDPNGQDLNTVTVLNRWEGALCDAPAILLEMAHDPLQRTFSGLHTHLVVNGGESTPLDTKITILAFEPKMSSLIRPSSSQIQKHGRQS